MQNALKDNLKKKKNQWAYYIMTQMLCQEDNSLSPGWWI